MFVLLRTFLIKFLKMFIYLIRGALARKARFICQILDKLQKLQAGRAAPATSCDHESGEQGVGTQRAGQAGSWKFTSWTRAISCKPPQAGPASLPRNRATKIFDEQLFRTRFRKIITTRSRLAHSNSIRLTIEKLDKLRKPTFCNRHFSEQNLGKQNF